MTENVEDWIKQNVKCCACGGTLKTSEVLNVYVTKKIATWKFPVFGVLDCPDFPPRATAYLCDQCMKNRIKIRYCIELEISAGQVTYHDFDSLVDADWALSKDLYYAGRMHRCKMLALKAARQQSEN